MLKKLNKLKLILFCYFILTTVYICNAQKTPKIQESALRAPANIKIDGSLTEWNNKLQAHNPLTRLSYTISNDDNNLYLTVLCYDNLKILRRGLAFTMSHSTEKKLREKAADNVSITFPTQGRKNISHLVDDISVGQDLVKKPALYQKQIDSLTQAMNKLVKNSFDEIGVTGIMGIKDTSISVYNLEGIKAIVQFNKKMGYIYELAMPLKLLQLSITDPSKFSYNIKLLAPPPIPPDPQGRKIGINEDALYAPADYYYLSSAVDFWGEYTLATK